MESDIQKEEEKIKEEQKNILDSILFGNIYTKIIEVLSENPQNCQINILGETKFCEKEDIKKFILKINKKEFDFIKDNNIIDSENCLIALRKMCSSSKIYFSNDIYRKYSVEDLIQNKINVELIYPATQKQIEKYKYVTYEIISETYELYLNKTLPYIQSIPNKDIVWIYNIFENNKETPIAKASSGNFLLLTNYTVINNIKTMSCLGIPIPSFSYIKSIRDLTQKELPLLEEFYQEGKKLVAEKYGFKPAEIRAFVHYPPSFYYFHIHYRSVNELNDNSSNINRAIDLGEVIQNIKLINNYYQIVTINHSVQVGSKLYQILNDTNYLNNING